MSGDWFKKKSFVAQTLFIVVILYALSSFVFLALVLGIVFPVLPGAVLNPTICLIYAIISFALTAIIAAYHLSTMMRRRKRKGDFNYGEEKNSGKEFVHG